MEVGAARSGRHHRGRVHAAHGLVDVAGATVAEHSQLGHGQGRGLVHPADVHPGQPAQVSGQQAGEQGQRQGGEEGGLGAAGHEVLAAGLDQPAGHLGEQLVLGHGPDGIEAEILAQGGAQPPADVRRLAEQPLRAAHIQVEVALAAGRLDQRRVVQGMLQAAAERPPVQLRPGRQDERGRAAAARQGEHHALAHAVRVGLVAHVVDHGAGRRLGDDQRPGAQGAIEQPFHGHREIGDVEVEDDPFHVAIVQPCTVNVKIEQW